MDEQILDLGKSLSGGTLNNQEKGNTDLTEGPRKHNS